MTLGNAAAARVRLILWCKDCQHQVEPDPGEMAARYGVETPVLEWHSPICSKRVFIQSGGTGSVPASNAGDNPS
jgi:hypothetical protein